MAKKFENNNVDMNKEVQNMKKFEINGIEYKFNAETGRYSKTENGKTVRIGKAEYEEAASIPTNVKTIPAESGDHLVEFARLGADYGVKFVGEDNYHMIAREEIESKVDPRDTDQKFYATFEFMGRRYWIKDATKNETKKAKKTPRKSKDIAYELKDGNNTVLTLTAKQVDFIRHIPDTCFYEMGLDSSPWCDVLADEIGGQFANKPMTVGAMISTLREKGVIFVDSDRINGKKAKFFYFSELGKKVAAELGLN